MLINHDDVMNKLSVEDRWPTIKLKTKVGGKRRVSLFSSVWTATTWLRANGFYNADPDMSHEFVE
jgi:hypothetical protein